MEAVQETVEKAAGKDQHRKIYAYLKEMDIFFRYWRSGRSSPCRSKLSMHWIGRSGYIRVGKADRRNESSIAAFSRYGESTARTAETDSYSKGPLKGKSMEGRRRRAMRRS